MATNTDIPQGYKATALGIIPQEWEVMLLGNLSNSISSGRNKHRDANGQYPVFGSTGIIGYSSTYEYEGPVILVARVGANAGTLNFASGQYDVSDNTLIITIKQNVYDYNFAYNQLTHYKLNKLVFGSGQPLITSKQLKNIRIPVPPLAEQQKIAEVLGVWDEAIEKQARLIEKLALRKRALMQRLLSAKLRLPGFSEPWKIHKLQELFTERNETNRTDLPLLSITGDRGVILQTESEKRDTSNDDKSKYKRIAKGDIGYNTMRMWQGRSALSGLEGIVSPAYTIVVPNTTDVDGYYMSVLFKQPRLVYDFWTHSQGLVGDTLNCKYRDFGQVHICCPPLAEQKAITEVLTAADREIELAKEKLKRLRRQKRGLMQQLLTGKKRVKYNEL